MIDFFIGFIIVVSLTILLHDCGNKSPEYLKYKDTKESICKKQCEPRQMESWDGLSGCECKVDKK